MDAITIVAALLGIITVTTEIVAVLEKWNLQKKISKKTKLEAQIKNINSVVSKIEDLQKKDELEELIKEVCLLESIDVTDEKADNPNINYNLIKGVQKKDEDILFDLKVSDDTDKTEVEHQFFKSNEARLVDATEQVRWEEKDEKINELKEINSVLANKQLDNVIQVNQESSSEEPGNKFENSRNLDITNSTVSASGAGSFNQRKITEIVVDPINSGSDSINYSKLDLPQLLTKLQETIETDPNFPSQDKQDIYDEIDNLTIASQETDIAIQQEKASKALRNLDRIVKLLPAGAAFITIFKEISPHISSWFRF